MQVDHALSRYSLFLLALPSRLLDRLHFLADLDCVLGNIGRRVRRQRARKPFVDHYSLPVRCVIDGTAVEAAAFAFLLLRGLRSAPLAIWRRCRRHPFLLVDHALVRLRVQPAHFRSPSVYGQLAATRRVVELAFDRVGGIVACGGGQSFEAGPFAAGCGGKVAFCVSP